MIKDKINSGRADRDASFDPTQLYLSDIGCTDLFEC